MDDRELIEAFRKTGEGELLDQLIERHRDWVYAMCLRRLGDSAAAEDATQAVFVALSRKAAGFSRAATVTGWLHRAARYASKNLRRAERRRVRHETEAAAMRPQTDANLWEEMRDDIEPAMDALGRSDREVLVLRYLRQMSGTEVGRELGISEEAAKKRVARALERLRENLAQRGIVTTGTRIGGAMLAGAVLPAPKALVTSLNAIGHQAASANVQILAKGVLTMMGRAKVLTMAAAVVVTVSVALATAVIAAGQDKKASEADTSQKTAIVAADTAATAPMDWSQERKNRATDGAKARNLVMAAIAWAANRGNRFPELADLVLAKKMKPDDFVGARRASAPLVLDDAMLAKAQSDPEGFAKEVDAHCDFLYFGSGLKWTSEPQMALCIEKPGPAAREGLIIGYEDGHAEFDTWINVRDILKRTNVLRRKHQASEIDVDAIMKQKPEDNPGGK